MTRIVDFIFLIFAAFLGKKALLLSVFAFMPSVLAAEVPVVTLSVDNIQVRAEWKVVGDDANHFRIEDGILMLQPNISGVGYPEGNTITAIVEVLDKFSTLNPSYEDLTVRVTLTAVIMGCRAHWDSNLAKAISFQSGRELLVESGAVSVGDVIMNTVSAGSLILHEVDYSRWRLGKLYIKTMPELYDSLKWSPGGSPSGWTSLLVNESADCFAEEIEIFQERQNTEYLNANAPLVSGYQARRVTVDTAFALSVSQHFYLYDVKLGGLLPRPNFIIDNGKAFRIDNSYPIDNSRYEYVANLTVASDGYWNNDPHEVIFFYQDCPTVYEVTTQYLLNSSSILIIDLVDGSKVKTYALFDGVVYKVTDIHERSVGVSFMLEGYSKVLTGQFQIKFSDHHFLCEGYP